MHEIYISTVIYIYIYVCVCVCVCVKEQIEVRECLLSFGAESFVFQFAIQIFEE